MTASRRDAIAGAIAKTLGPLREQREQFVERLAQVEAEREELRAGIRRIDSIVKAAEPTERAKQKYKRGARSAHKKHSIIGVADDKVDLVLDLVGRLKEPQGTAAIAAKLDGKMSQSNVGKVLSYLADEQKIRRAGALPGKGRRPMYGPWPKEAVTNGSR